MNFPPHHQSVSGQSTHTWFIGTAVNDWGFRENHVSTHAADWGELTTCRCRIMGGRWCTGCILNCFQAKPQNQNGSKPHKELAGRVRKYRASVGSKCVSNLRFAVYLQRVPLQPQTPRTSRAWSAACCSSEYERDRPKIDRNWDSKNTPRVYSGLSQRNQSDQYSIIWDCGVRCRSECKAFAENQKDDGGWSYCMICTVYISIETSYFSQ